MPIYNSQIGVEKEMLLRHRGFTLKEKEHRYDGEGCVIVVTMIRGNSFARFGYPEYLQ